MSATLRHFFPDNNHLAVTLRTYFADLSATSEQELCRISRYLTFAKGQMLTVQGRSAEFVYLLLSGWVKLSLVSESGRNFAFRVVTGGVPIGLEEVISGREYDSSSECLQDCEAIQFRAAAFLQLARRHPDISMCAAQHLAAQYRELHATLRTLTFSRNIAARLARLLLGADGQPELRRHMKLTHEQMAELIGTSRESVTRILAEFRRLRAIENDRSSVRVTDRVVLQRLSAE